MGGAAPEGVPVGARLIGPSPGRDAPTTDDSLRLLAAPSVFREVESVYHDILRELREDPDLLLSDIAVRVTDLELYRPALQATFESGPARLPYNVADLSAAQESLYGAAVLALIELGLAATTRREVFAVLANPCFLAAAGVARETVGVFERWVTELHAYHGFDAADEAEHGYTADETHTFSQCLRRLRLSAVIDTPDEEVARRTFRGYRGHLPHPDLGGGERDDLSAFSRAVADIARAARRLRQPAVRRPEEWADVLVELVDELLAVPEDRPEEGAVRRALGGALEGVRELSRLLAIGGRGEVSLALVREVLREDLAALATRLGDRRGLSVSVGVLRAIRPLPARITYALGLDEGAFPGRDEPDALDLRHEPGTPHALGRTSDIAKDALNDYVLLETLVATERKLVLSYVCRDLAKDEERYESPSLARLNVLAAAEGGSLAPVTVPLHGWSLRYLAGSAEAEGSAMGAPALGAGLANYAPIDRLLCLLDPANAPRLGLTARQRQELADLVATRRPTREAVPDDGSVGAAVPEVTTVGIHELVRFVIDPLEGALRRHLRLYDADEFLDAEAGEPLYTAFEGDFVEVGTEDAVVRATGVSPASAIALARDYLGGYHDSRRLAGAAPRGVFGELDLERLRARFEGVTAALTEFLEERALRDFAPSVSLGVAPVVEDASEGLRGLTFPPGVLDVTVRGRPCRVHIHGAASLVFETAEQVEVLAHARGTVSLSGKPERPSLHRALLGPRLLEAAILAGPAESPARRWLGRRSLVVHLLAGGKPQAWQFPPMAPAEAREWLLGLLGDLLDPLRFEALPFAVLNGTALLSPAFDPALVDDAAFDPEAPAGCSPYASAVRRAIEEDALDARPRWRLSEAEALLGDVIERVPEDALDRVRRRFRWFAGV
jgi:exodeoxyribonuclease V gamma subunit